MARVTGLEPAAFGVTGRRSNQLSYTRNIINKPTNGLLPVCHNRRQALGQKRTPCQPLKPQNPKKTSPPPQITTHIKWLFDLM